MASGYNHITLVGNLVEDPKPGELEGIKRVTLSTEVSVNPPRKGGSAPVDIINIIAIGKFADLCLKHLKKGRRILVDGKLHIYNIFGCDLSKPCNQRKEAIDCKERVCYSLGKQITEVMADNVTFLETREQ